VGAHLLGLLAIWLIEPLAWVYLAGFACSVILTAVISLFIARPAPPRAVKGAASEALKIGMPVLPHTGALMLLTQGAVFLLAATAGKVESGDYGKVQIFALGTITILGALNNAWVPSLMAASREERPGRLRGTLKIASLAGLAVVIVAAGGANAITHIIADGREDLVPVAQILPLTAIGYLLYLNATTLLFSDKKTGLLAVITPVVLLAGLALGYRPASEGDLVGVAAASAGSFLLLGLSYFLVARHRAEGGWPVRLYLACGAAGTAYVLVLLSLPNDLATGLTTIGVVAVLGLVALGAFRTRLRALAV
jgi:O-antigen/teichoic acid export membrane protein